VGSADLIEESGQTITIRDYKTGVVHDRNGEISDHIQFQLRLYGLLALEARPSARVRLLVEHTQAEEVAFDPPAVEASRKRLTDLLAILRPGERQDAATLARFGPHCRSCDIRHRCATYLSSAPTQWRASRTDHPMALDVWGTLADAPRKERTGAFSVRLRDAAERHVSVIALDSRHGNFEELRAGDALWMFGLESRGDLRTSSNEYLHPTNFRELSCGAGERRAFRLRVYTS
jgi:hypothetical protein